MWREQIPHPSQAPRRLHILRREQPRDRHTKVRKRQPHQHQRQHEVRRRHPHVVEDGKHVVERRPRVRRRVDAGGDRHHPRDDKGQRRQHHGERQPLADQLDIRPLILQRQPKVAGDEVLHPLEVLNPNGLIQPVLAAEGRNLLGSDRAARGRQRSDVRRQKVPRRRLHDGKHRDGEDQHQQRQQKQPLQDDTSHEKDTPGLVDLVETGDAGRRARAPWARHHGEPSSAFERRAQRASHQQLEEPTPQPPWGMGGPSSLCPERVTPTGEPCGRAHGARARRPASPVFTRSRPRLSARRRTARAARSRGCAAASHCRAPSARYGTWR